MFSILFRTVLYLKFNFKLKLTNKLVLFKTLKKFSKLEKKLKKLF